MNSEDDALREAFMSEAGELLCGLEASLVDLENNPEDGEAVSAIFRVFHTLKGSGGMCGFDDLSDFTHHIETVYDLVRSREITVNKTLIDLTLSACDLIRAMTGSQLKNEAEITDRAAELLSSFRTMVPERIASERFLPGNPTGKKVYLASDMVEKTTTYRIRFRPLPGIFLSGTDPLLLLNELRSLGECTVVAHTDAIPDLGSLDPQTCRTSWDIILTGDCGINRIRDVFIFVEDESDLMIDVIDEEGVFDPGDCIRLGEILVDKRDLSQEDLDLMLILKGKKPLGEMLIDQGLVKSSQIEAALAEQEQVRKAVEGRHGIDGMSNIRVSSRKLDRLVNLVGELVTAQARLSQTSLVRNDPELVSIAEEVERLVGDLRANAMDIRMMPIGTIFSIFKRLVRDISKELGKEVELITAGGETELDKTVIEKLNDPLVHLIRNSLDHGIEMPEAREKSGKPRKGTIRLTAAHSGNHVVIRIMDDGAGLDAEVIRAKAVKMGLLAPDDVMTEKEIFPLVLSAGFTTASSVTNISGRGVGMDVVKKAVDSLGGTIHLESLKASGTTITLVLPLTLAIVEGLLVRVGEESFVLPLSAVEECVELTRRDEERSNGRRIANIRGGIVPYISLREHFMVGGLPPAMQQIVIIRNGEQKVGLVVDKVVGEHQTVIKPLGQVFKDLEGISGAAILGDGSVALIVDIPKVLKNAEKEEAQMMR
jgi:two-component system chemotaxis sensor kinase CheA